MIYQLFLQSLRKVLLVNEISAKTPDTIRSSDLNSRPGLNTLVSLCQLGVQNNGLHVMEPKISSGEMVNLQDLNTVVQEQTSKI